MNEPLDIALELEPSDFSTVGSGIIPATVDNTGPVDEVVVTDPGDTVIFIPQPPPPSWPILPDGVVLWDGPFNPNQPIGTPVPGLFGLEPFPFAYSTIATPTPIVGPLPPTFGTETTTITVDRLAFAMVPEPGVNALLVVGVVLGLFGRKTWLKRAAR